MDQDDCGNAFFQEPRPIEAGQYGQVLDGMGILKITRHHTPNFVALGIS